jgi:hypothetical protein
VLSDNLISTIIEVTTKHTALADQGDKKGKAAANLRLSPLFGSFGQKTYLLVVLVFVDALADPVLALIQVALFGLGQMAVMLRHVIGFLLLHAGLAPFQIGSLLRAQRAVVDAVGDTLLLILFAAVYLIYARVTRIDDARSSA